jgi:predicted type IV restriction endonuclease
LEKAGPSYRGGYQVSEEFKNRLLVHARTAVDRAGRAQNEEATKQWLIIPFFHLLGYDPNDPDEVFPEADASFSDKFKNRVDYAIYREGDPVIAVEAKKVGTLSTANRGELKGYYNAVPTVKLGILTDGLLYQLYSDTEAENLMDDAPFAVVDLEQIAQETIADEAFDALLKIRRDTFDPADIGADARRKIYISEYVEALEDSFRDPDETVVRTLMDVAGVEGRRTNKLLAEHKLYIVEAMNAFFDKKLLERVGFAEREDLVKVPPAELQIPAPAQESPSEQPVAEQPKTEGSDIVTTEAEEEVYDYVKRRLPFLIDRDEDLYRRLDDVNYRDYKGAFTISYKQDRKGRLLNFREGADGSYRFEFPESGEVLVTNDLSDIDDMLLAIFMRRVEELG